MMPVNRLNRTELVFLPKKCLSPVQFHKGDNSGLGHQNSAGAGEPRQSLLDHY